MPKTQVTAALYNYLTPENSNLPTLGKVYTALPKVGSEADLFLYMFPGQAVGTAIYMFIESQSEKRIALGGTHGGNKFRIYNLALMCVNKSNFPDPVDGQAAFDEFVDSLTNLIQENRTAGDPYNIFQWGEGGINGGIDIMIEYPVPKTIKGASMLFQAILRVQVCEVFSNT